MFLLMFVYKGCIPACTWAGRVWIGGVDGVYGGSGVWTGGILPLPKMATAAVGAHPIGMHYFSSLRLV